MIDKHLIEDIKHVSLSLFNKNFFGVYHGSISARVSSSGFIINSKDTILDEFTEESLVKLDCQKRDYRWSMANTDVHIHEHIYETIPNAKYVCYTMPPYATAYSLKHGKVSPQDYFGQKVLGEIIVYDPKNIDDWMNVHPMKFHSFSKNMTHICFLSKVSVLSLMTGTSQKWQKRSLF